jgi:hypothetical protein
MASLPPEPILPRDPAPQPDADASATLAEQWDKLHERAAALARLARLAPEPPQPRDAFAALVDTASDWQLAHAGQGIADVAALLDSGLAALATLSARGQDAAVPALALWREFHAARGAVLHGLRPHVAA